MAPAPCSRQGHTRCRADVGSSSGRRRRPVRPNLPRRTDATASVRLSTEFSGLHIDTCYRSHCLAAGCRAQLLHTSLGGALVTTFSSLPLELDTSRRELQRFHDQLLVRRTVLVMTSPFTMGVSLVQARAASHSPTIHNHVALPYVLTLFFAHSAVMAFSISPPDFVCSCLAHASALLSRCLTSALKHGFPSAVTL
jgi:hypothetical protein